ncbi:MAG: hypothetical protein QXW71_00035 [Thermoplasmata archaeon]
MQKNKNNSSVKDWLPVLDIQKNIIILKNGGYVKILEITPINFNLKSKTEKKNIILNYRSFLKSCRFPMQIVIQCKKADTSKYVEKIKRYMEEEKNESVKKMIRGHLELVESLGSRGAVSRRFFLVLPYEKPPGVKNVTFEDVEKQFFEREAIIQENLSKCGNNVIEINDEEFALKVLMSFLNKVSSELKYNIPYKAFAGVLSSAKINGLEEE